MSVFLWSPCFPFFMLYLTLSQLSAHWLRVCLFEVCVLMYTCIRASVCIWPQIWLVYMCVCVIPFISLSAPPSTVTCSPFLLIVLPLCQARESGAGGACRKSSSLVALRRKANSEMHKHRKCCFPHAGSSLGVCHSENSNVSVISNHTCLCEPFGLLHLGCPLHCQRTQ